MVRLALALAAAVLALGTASLAQTPSPTIRIGAAPDDQGRPLLYAAQSGMFKKAGLNVEIVKLANGSAVAAAIAGGSLELGKGSSLSPVQGYAKGIKFVVVANLANYSSAAPDTALIVLRDAPIKTPKDLVGKTIGVAGLEDLNTLSIYAWLDKNGLQASQVHFVEMPYSAAPAALEQHRIDATVALEPLYSAAMATGKFRVLAHPWSAIANRFSDAVLYGNASWINAHRDTVVKLNQVLHDAAVYVSAHQSETTHIAAAYGGFDSSKLKDFHPPAWATDLQPGDLQPTIDDAAKYKMIPKAFPASEIICDCAVKR